MNAERSFKQEEWTSWVLEHEAEDVSLLALRYSGNRHLPLKFLLNQVKGRQIAKQKLPSFYARPEILYPDTLILEQCSSELTAAHKAAWAAGKIVADLTGGLGIDTLAFAKTAKKVFFCEPDAARCEAAHHNFKVLGVENVEVSMGAASETAAALLDQAAIFFLDPSRRREDGRKVFRIEDLSPNLLALKELLLSKGALVMVKLAPLLDISEGLRQLPESFRVEVISRKDECRELLFFLSDTAEKPEIVCIDTGFPERTFSFRPAEEALLPLPIGAPENYLYEPDASIRKAGPWRSICEKFGVKMLHPNSHLFSGNEYIANFPGRVFYIEHLLPYKKETIQNYLQGNPAQMVFYNFPVDAREVTKSLGIKSGEPKYLFFTQTTARGPIVLLTSRLML